MEESFDRLWKIKKLLEILHSIFSKVYNTSKYQAAEKFVFHFKRKAVFIQCVMNEQCIYGIKIQIWETTVVGYDKVITC